MHIRSGERERQQPCAGASEQGAAGAGTIRATLHEQRLTLRGRARSFSPGSSRTCRFSRHGRPSRPGRPCEPRDASARCG